MIPVIQNRRLEEIEAAQVRLGNIGRTTLYRLFDTGEITRVKIGRRALVDAASVDAYIQRLTDAPQAGSR